MNIVRRNVERRHIVNGKCDMWLTFYPQEPPGLPGEGFGYISVLNEIMLPPNEGFVSKLENKSELITYVNKGVLALAGPMEHSGVITAGEFQCMVIGRAIGQRVTNTSQTDLAHFFRIYLRTLPSQRGVDWVETHTRITVAQRRNVLFMIGSPDAQKASLRINTDAHIYSSILDPGQHIVYELLQERKAWLHIVHGKVKANDVVLTTGDGMGIDNESSISLTVQENTELLLIDTISDSGKVHR